MATMRLRLLLLVVVASATARCAAALRVSVYRNGESEDARELQLDAAAVAAAGGDVAAALNAAGVRAAKAGRDGGVPVARVFNGDGEHVTAFAQLRDGDRLYTVADGLHFVWPFVRRGHEVTLRATTGAEFGGGEHELRLVSVSDSPRVFRLRGFFDGTDASTLIANVEAISDPEFALRRSSVGPKTGKERQLSDVRTSDNAFDSSSPTARKLIRRAFDLLTVPYDVNLADGLQLVRYREKQAYISHTDWFAPDADPAFNFEPANGGANRFATVFLYLREPEVGGQTVFPHGERQREPGAVVADADAANDGANANDDADAAAAAAVPPELDALFPEPDTWQHKMVRQCYSKLAMPPRALEAVLFYSQTGNGTMDASSLHGGCPVLRGTKWGANLWVWNRMRHGIDPKQAPTDGGSGASHVRIGATFRNVRSDNAPLELYWGSSVLGRLAGAGDGASGTALRFETFDGHVWEARRAGAGVESPVLWRHKMRAADGATQTLNIGDDGGDSDDDDGDGDDAAARTAGGGGRGGAALPSRTGDAKLDIEALFIQREL